MSAVPRPPSAFGPNRRRETLTAFGLVLPALIGLYVFSPPVLTARMPAHPVDSDAA